MLRRCLGVDCVAVKCIENEKHIVMHELFFASALILAASFAPNATNTFCDVVLFKVLSCAEGAYHQCGCDQLARPFTLPQTARD